MANQVTKTAPSSAPRKTDHIRLALEQQQLKADPRFYYEPLFGHQNFSEINLALDFLGKHFMAPLWISSMTGGTHLAETINRRLAEAVARFDLGMGLGSLRPLLEGRQSLRDFQVRPILGPERCLLGNIGIAQVDELWQKNDLQQLRDILEELQCDGVIVHINPIQEWYQPEGSLLHRPPLYILEDLLAELSLPVVVKEVGQGMGPQSLRALMELPLAAIELGAFGGTNFSAIEWERSKKLRPRELAQVGHGAEEMIGWINQWEGGSIKCRQFIISGGVRSFLDGHYLMHRLRYPSIYGQASAFLAQAMQSQQALNDYVESQMMGLQMARSFLRVCPE